MNLNTQQSIYNQSDKGCIEYLSDEDLSDDCEDNKFWNQEILTRQQMKQIMLVSEMLKEKQEKQKQRLQRAKLLRGHFELALAGDANEDNMPLVCDHDELRVALSSSDLGDYNQSRLSSTRDWRTNLEENNNCYDEKNRICNHTKRRSRSLSRSESRSRDGRKRYRRDRSIERELYRSRNRELEVDRKRGTGRRRHEDARDKDRDKDRDRDRKDNWKKLGKYSSNRRNRNEIVEWRDEDVFHIAGRIEICVGT